MIANVLILTIALLLAIGFWLMGELKFLANYRAVLFHSYGNIILGWFGFLFLNVFAAVYLIERKFFLRDTGRDGPVVMLLHGWMASADLNWCGAYGDLFQAGYRVLAIDHRGHGRGLRPLERFRLAPATGRSPLSVASVYSFSV